jgi:hypothetical protein
MELNYDKAFMLDAEGLAEEGIAKADEQLLPELKHYVPTPLVVHEQMDGGTSYSVSAGTKQYSIYPSPRGGKNYNSWGIAAVAFFSIVNEQLTHSSVKFYAINGGNDLMEIFLTVDEAEQARRSLPRKQDWPYIPSDTYPWFGQYHSVADYFLYRWSSLFHREK